MIVGRSEVTGARRGLARVESIVRSLGGVALLGGLLASCAPASSAIGPPGSPPCLRAIPASRLAVHGVGRYAGLRYLSARQLARDLSSSEELRADRSLGQGVPPQLARMIGSVCAVAWKGSYTASSVESGWPARPPASEVVGRLAVVVVDAKDAKVLVTVVLEHSTLGFARVFPHLLETPILR